jgi:hypothetical protein
MSAPRKSKYPEFYFESSGGEGPLYIYFEDGPYGNAIDDETGDGAGFFDEYGHLVAVLFDRVLESADHKVLKFKKEQFVEIKVSKGKVVDIKSTYLKPPKSILAVI